MTYRQNPKTVLQGFQGLFSVCRELSTRCKIKRGKQVVETPTNQPDVEVGTFNLFTLAQAKKGGV